MICTGHCSDDANLINLFQKILKNWNFEILASWIFQDYNLFLAEWYDIEKFVKVCWDWEHCALRHNAKSL